MGLDMYLMRRTNDIKLKIINSLENKDLDMEDIWYWRKANWIHNWFVLNVQDGDDDCEYHVVSKDKLLQLLDTIKIILLRNSKADELLPTTAGFFFGSVDYNDDYFNILKETKDILEKVLEETDFNKQEIVYRSSW